LRDDCITTTHSECKHVLVNGYHFNFIKILIHNDKPGQVKVSIPGLVRVPGTGMYR
jgi:hypothetical protein